MKKQLLPVLLLGAISFAQPVLQAGSMLPNSHGIYYSAPSQGYSNGAPGENFWDFYSFTLTQIATASVVAKETVPFYEEFPTANYCTRNDDTVNGLYYNLFKTDENSHEFVGYADSESWSNYESDPLVLLQFPFTYNSEINDTFESNGLGQGTVYTRTYDAYGTVVTPFGQFENVIRLKIVSGSGTRYTWFSSNPYFPIVLGNMDNGTVNFYQELSLNTTQPHKAAFSMYPNPCNNHLTIDNQQYLQGNVTVYDSKGNVVVADKSLQSSTQISLEHCSSGVYFVELTNKDGQVLQVEKIIKN